MVNRQVSFFSVATLGFAAALILYFMNFGSWVLRALGFDLW